ncbi:MAG: P-II family nitrogen regulator [Candidatus Binataceae bacterium]
MKKVEAILTPHRLDAVRALLLERGCQDIVVSEVRSAEGRAMHYRGVDYTGDTPRIKVEAVVPDAEAMSTAEAILHGSPEHSAKDERVTLSALDHVISIGISKLDRQSPELSPPVSRGGGHAGVYDHPAQLRVIN